MDEEAGALKGLRRMVSYVALWRQCCMGADFIVPFAGRDMLPPTALPS